MNEPSNENHEESESGPAPEKESRATSETKTSDPHPGRGGSWTGGLALLISLLAAGAAGYLAYEHYMGRGTSGQLDGMQTALDAQVSELQRLGSAAQTLLDAEQRLTSDVENMSGPLTRQLEEIPLRLKKLESALEDVPGVADKARSAWLLAEIEYFLRIANSQLSLAGNADIALSAMNIADEKLRDLADPRFTPVRAMLSDERAALKAIPRPDSEGIVLALGSLARTIDKFPLANGTPSRFAGDGTPINAESGVERAWRVIKEALSGIISVKKATEVDVAPIMSTADEIMLRRSLDMEMQIARIAIIRNEGQLFGSSIESIRERLGRYFDGENPAVTAALSTLDELGHAQLTNELPDISGSLVLLLELNSGAATP